MELFSSQLIRSFLMENLTQTDRDRLSLCKCEVLIQNILDYQWLVVDKKLNLH